MKVFTLTGVCAMIALLSLVLSGCSQESTGSSGAKDIRAACELFQTNTPNARVETASAIVAYLKENIRTGQSTNITANALRQLLGKPDKEVETIQTDGNILVWRYQLTEKPKGGQYESIDQLVLRFKSNILVEVAKQRGWIPRGGG